MVELAKQYQLRIFVPSTIGAFGPDSPRSPTPNVTVSNFEGRTYFKRRTISGDEQILKGVQIL